MQARCWQAGRRWLELLALLMALCAPAASACDRPLRVAMGQLPPYILRDARGAASGAEPELLRAILQQAGCQLEIVPDLPRKRRYAMFLAGELDILLAASETVERREVAWFTPPYRMETTAWFALPAKAAALRELDGFGAVLQRRIPMVTQNLGWFGVEYATLLPQLQQAKLISSTRTRARASTCCWPRVARSSWPTAAPPCTRPPSAAWNWWSCPSCRPASRCT